MFQHVIYPQVPPAILGYLLPVSQAAPQIPVWGELIDCCAYLRTTFPDRVFLDEPQYYVDLHAMNIGFLFCEQNTGDAYFIHRADQPT